MSKGIHILSAFALAAFIIGCNNSSRVLAASSDSTNATDQQQGHSPLKFTPVTLFVDTLKNWKASGNAVDSVILQLENPKEGVPGDMQHRHLYELIVYKAKDGKYQDGSGAIKEYGAAVTIPDKGDGRELRLGNYNFSYDTAKFPVGAVYLKLTPCLGDTIKYPNSSLDFTHYILYKKQYYNSDMKEIEQTDKSGSSTYINPSPPA